MGWPEAISAGQMLWHAAVQACFEAVSWLFV